MPRYIASIDQGTSSTRCILFDRSGPVVTAQREHRQIFPKPGWVEHDAMEIWQRVRECVGEALDAVGARVGDVGAVGITNQRETVVAWDVRTGRPVCNAIVWQDVRTAAACEQLAKESPLGIDRFRAKTGLPLATYFSGPKMKWVLDHVPGAAQLLARGDLRMGTIDSWITWWLTGGPHGGRVVTDVTNASRTMLMDLHALQWDDDLLRDIGVPRDVLPQIVPSSNRDESLMTTTDGPFNAAISIAGILGDQQAALVGQCCFEPGEAKNTYGTGCFMLLNTGERAVESKAGLLTTVGYQFGANAKPVYALEGSIAVAGALVQWLRDNLGIVQGSNEVEPLARSVADTGGVYIVPAFNGLFAPYWRSDARGTIVGLTRHSTRAHIARAALEATAYQTRDVLEAMRTDSGVALQSLKVDGGMSVNDLLMQTQADTLGIPVARPGVTETTAQGAAFAAGLATGFWSGVDELRATYRIDRTWTPAIDEGRRAGMYRDWKRAVERSLGWV
jgi:glycerol kinase